MVAKQDTTIRISPDVLKWVIQSSGWDAEELSKETSIRVESITEWETVTTPIRVRDLQTVAKAIDRPLSVMLLPEPPMEKNPTDYRKTGRDKKEKLDKRTLTAIRNARYIQSNARDMLELRSEKMQPSISTRTLNDDPEEVAEIEKDTLGWSTENRLPKEAIDKFVRRAYQTLRDKIESLNILVMQASMPLNDARGLTLADGYPRVILVNSADDARPKLFTLLHEYAHLLLKTDGICMTNSENFKQAGVGEKQNASVERWCNTFAGAVIMPKGKFLDEFEHADARHEPDKVIVNMSSKFCTSKAAAVVRILNLLGNDPRRNRYHKYYAKIMAKPIKVSNGGPPSKDGRNMAKECINRNGKRYVQIVSDSRERNLINTSDMIKYLGLKTKHFEELHSLI